MILLPSHISFNCYKLIFGVKCLLFVCTSPVQCLDKCLHYMSPWVFKNLMNVFNEDMHAFTKLPLGSF